VTRTVLRAVTLLACVFACALVVAACGSDGGSESTGAQRLLEDTFATTATDVKSGRLTVDVKLDPEGLLALGGPITLKATGPFEVSADSKLPSFDLRAVAEVAGNQLRAGALSDGKNAYLELDGDDYILEDTFLDKLRSGEGAVGIAALGIDPRGWITDVQEKGSEQVGGVDTVHLTGGIDAPKLLADVEKIVGTLPAGKQGSAQQRKDIADAVKSAQVEVWSGKQDKILRQLLVKVAFDFPSGATPPIPGLDKGKVELRARIDGVNGVKANVATPSRSKPLSELPDSGVGGLVKCVMEAVAKGDSLATCAASLL
jgi:hypothetical protein